MTTKRNVYITAQRRKMLRVLANAERHLSTREIAARAELKYNTVQISMEQLLNTHGWLEVWGNLPPKPGHTRYFALTTAARNYVRTTVLRSGAELPMFHVKHPHTEGKQPVSRRPVEYEVNDLAVHLEAVGMTEKQARKEAERIRDSIGAHYYAKGFTDGQRSGSPIESLDDLINEETA